MSLSRRKTLALLGGGTLLAATGTFAHSVTRKPTAAQRPWHTAGTYTDPILRALSWAILAPNPHNRQPWIVDLSTPDTATLYVDTTRLLPHTDPFSRQIVIGLGCFLELLRMAALEDGYAVEVDLFPQGSDPERLDQRPVAICHFAPTTLPRDPLFAHVPQRRSLKVPYDTSRPVAPSQLARILAAARSIPAGGSLDARDIAELRQLTRDALIVELETPHTYRESVDLFRIGRREVEAQPDGIDFTGPLFETMARLGLFTREAALDRGGMAYREGLNAVLANTDSAMGHIWLVSDTNTRADQIAAGADWLRMNLAVTAEGLGMQPLSQALQEYPQMADLYTQVHDRLAPGGGVVQMLSRIGYGPQADPSPRWPLEAKVMDERTS